MILQFSPSRPKAQAPPETPLEEWQAKTLAGMIGKLEIIAKQRPSLLKVLAEVIGGLYDPASCPTPDGRRR